MREDMHKVIVERPRVGGNYAKPGREGARERMDPESAPTKEKMKRRGGTKSLNDNLQPLYRFLQKQVGRPWDKVRSEISKGIRLTSAVQAHVMQHVKGYVEEHAVLIEGVPYHAGRGGWRPVSEMYRRRFEKLYVCPATGLLKRAKPPAPKKPKHPAPKVVRVSQYVCAVRMRGCWHEATMKRAPFFDTIDQSVEDAILGTVRYYIYPIANFYPKWKGEQQYAVKVRPMTRDEIRRLDLR